MKAAKEAILAPAKGRRGSSDTAPANSSKTTEAKKRAARAGCHALVQQVAVQKAFKARLAGVGKGLVTLDHVTPRAYGFAVALLLQQAKPRARVWIICGDPKVQDSIHAELSVWQTPALYFPKLMTSTVANALPDPDVQAERVSVLSELREAWNGKQTGSLSRAVVLLATSLDEEVPALLELDAQQRFVSVGDKLDAEGLIHELSEAGYERVSQVTERGQFARRGGIVDFYTWQADEPLRVELFDDEVESLRVFDVNDQGSLRRVEKMGFILKLSDDGGAASRVQEHIAAGDIVVGVECHAGPMMNVWITEGAADNEGVEDYSTAIHDGPLGMFDASDFVLREARRKQFDKQLAEWHGDGWQTVIFFNNEAERERFGELVGTEVAGITTQLGLLYRGFTVPAAKLAVLTGAEIFGRHQIVRRIKGSKLDETQALRHARELVRELSEHDLVVHVEHGIGKFTGIEIRGEGKQREEVLVLRYADEAKLFVSMANAHLVSRYVGVGGKAPSLNKLGDAKWQRTRKNAERSVEEFAARMLSIAAERTTVKADPHPPDTKWQAEFEGSFIYQETPDQLRCVEEIKRDMESERPMDRLLCADVGFGKTEVAIRAAFKTVMAGRQVAILVPTTVLASQHWKTLRERMSEFPVKVEMLCRLTPADKEREIIRGLKDGSVDIVIGTHRVISKDVHFKNLGLAVVDEEQRFGVKHKEKFKELFRLIDVLTLSATPIPRTLYLALTGARDLSTLETPPQDRLPVETIVGNHDERVIRDAIARELERGGQVFFLHNRISTIEGVALRLKALVPVARVVIGHGQMDADDLEKVMTQFVNGDADVLVSTTIIESGLDIPNANTIIIDRADRFGLSELYQLRGRVGRYKHQAYCHLLLPRHAQLLTEARKRMSAIKQYSALGSGFKIAMRDLEIRGAGNLLGPQQSGHITAVGFELYCQLLQQSIAAFKGEPVKPRVDVRTSFDFLATNPGEEGNAKAEGKRQKEEVRPKLHIEVPREVMTYYTDEDAPSRTTHHAPREPLPKAPAYLPIDYIREPAQRLEVYRRFAQATDRAALDAVKRELTDRFGPPPAPVELLLTVGELKLLAAERRVNGIEVVEDKVKLTRNGELLTIGGHFPRLAKRDAKARLGELKKLLLAL